MAMLRFVLRRFAAQRLLGAAVVVTLAFSVGVLVAGPVYANAAREAILSSTLGDSSVTVANARLQVFAGEGFDWAGTDQAIESQVARLPVSRIVSQGIATVRIGGPDGPSVPLLYRDGSEANLSFEGEPPGPGQVAIVAGTAQTAGTEIGDDLEVLGPNGRRMTLTVSGTFRPPDAGDPFWFGSRSPFPAPESSQPQPILVSRETALRAARELGLTTELSWDVYLALRGVPFVEARQIPGRLQAIEADLQGRPGLDGLRLLTGLDTLMRLVEQRVENLRIPILLVVFQVGAVTLAVLAGVGTLTLTRQAFELAVLHSRGFSRRALLVAQAVQAAIAVVVALPLGLLLGLGLARLAGLSNGPTLPGVLFPVRLSGAANLLGSAAAATGAAILLLLSLPHVSRSVLEERQAASREDRPLLSRLPVELLVLPVALFAFVQLRGGTKPEPGSGSIDPLVLLAPTLLLFAGSFLSLRLLLFVLRRMDRRIGRTASLPAYLAGRKLGRTPGTSFAAALLLLLSMGLLVVSTSYRAIVLRNHADAAHAVVGADWNVQVAPPGDVLRAIADMPPDTTPVVRTQPDLASGSFSLPPTALAIDPATFMQGGWWRSDFSDTSIQDILAALPAPPVGLELPPGASTLTLGLDAPKAAAGLDLSATTLDAEGGARTPEPQPIAAGRGTYRVPLAPGSRLLSITFQAETTLDLPFRLSIGIESAEIEGAPLSLDGWEPLTWRGSGGTLRPEGPGYRFRVQTGAGRVVAGLVPSPAALPALLSSSVAASAGDRLTVTLGGQQVELRRIATAEQFPSVVPNAPFVVVSAPALLERELAVPEAGLTVNEAWAMGTASPLPALRASGFVPGLAVQRALPIEGVLAQLPQSLAVGMNFTVAAGGTGLVVLGVAASLYFAERRRTYELASLRAMGMERSQIRRTLILEQAVLLGFSVAAGLGLGYLVLRLVMPSIGTSLGVSYPAPVLVMDWTSLGVALAAIALATSVALGLAIRASMRSSVTGVLRGEAE